MIFTLTPNPSLDKSSDVERVEPDRKLRCSPPRYDPGGGGLNVARAVTKLGGRAVALWTRGGPLGLMLGELLDAEGIEHRPFEVDGFTRENLMVRERSSDRHYRFGMPGPELSEEEGAGLLREVERLGLDERSWVVASGSLPRGLGEDFYGRVARLAAEKGARYVVDTSGPPLRKALETGVWLVKPNIPELEELTGREIEDESSVVAKSRELIRGGKVRVVVVSLGAGGAVLVSEGRVAHVPAPTVPIRSRVGAGDSMVAGIVLALDRGRPLEEAVRFGVAAGAAAVMTPGSELCRREDVERLYEST